MLHLTRRHAAIGTLTLTLGLAAIVAGVSAPSRPSAGQPTSLLAQQPPAVVRVRAAHRRVRRQRRRADRALPMRRTQLRRRHGSRRRDAAMRGIGDALTPRRDLCRIASHASPCPGAFVAAGTNRPVHACYNCRLEIG